MTDSFIRPRGSIDHEEKRKTKQKASLLTIVDPFFEEEKNINLLLFLTVSFIIPALNKNHVSQSVSILFERL